MTKEASDKALERAEILRPLLSPLSQGQSIGRAVEAAAQLNISRSTAWRILNMLREHDGRASSRLPKRSGPKPGSLRLPAQVESMIARVLRERYLVPERPSLREIVGEIRAECVAIGFQPPARQTIKARLDAMDQREVLRKRKGGEGRQTGFRSEGRKVGGGTATGNRPD